MSLPPEEHQEALLEALAGLVGAQGHLPLVSSHLLEPTPRYFPDVWRPDVDGAANVARRLLGYAGLGHLDVRVDRGEGLALVAADAGSSVGGTTHASVHEGAAAWFLGIADGRCHFGVDESQLGEPEGLVGTLCHEVAHAYRAANRLALEDRRLEEPLTDVTTVFLGFGILTTNAAYRYRASGGLEGTMTVTRWSHTRSGYLPPEAMAFLLATQVVARRMPGGAVRRVRALLEPNQASAFGAAERHLRRRGDVERRLGLPALPAWPEPPPLSLADPPRLLPPADPGQPPLDLRRERNAGRPVFRIRARRTAAGGFAGLGVGLTAGLLLMWAGLSPEVLSWLVLGGISAGATAGAARVRYECSTSDCGATLTATTRVCPGCGGDVSGEIRSARERLEAEERVRRQRGEPEAEVDADPGA